MGSATIARQAAAYVARWQNTLQKKHQKVMLKIYFGLEKYGLFCYGGTISVFRSISISLWSRNLGKTWQQWLQCLQRGGGGVGLLLHACILITGRMHANSSTEA